MVFMRRGLVFCSADSSSGQSAGSAISSKRSIGGKRLRMILTARRHATRETGGVPTSLARPLTRRRARRRDSGAPARSEEHTSELQSLMRISYDVFCLKKKNTKQMTVHQT